jgi:hypothetical protein
MTAGRSGNLLSFETSKLKASYFIQANLQSEVTVSASWTHYVADMHEVAAEVEGAAVEAGAGAVPLQHATVKLRLRTKHRTQKPWRTS